jgi:hypothetical protein
MGAYEQDDQGYHHVSAASTELIIAIALKLKSRRSWCTWIYDGADSSAVCTIALWSRVLELSLFMM